MKLVDVLGAKQFSDSERIITQVRLLSPYSSCAHYFWNVLDSGGNLTLFDFDFYFKDQSHGAFIMKQPTMLCNLVLILLLVYKFQQPPVEIPNFFLWVPARLRSALNMCFSSSYSRFSFSLSLSLCPLSSSLFLSLSLPFCLSQQGDKADCFYIVESGEVKIMMKSKVSCSLPLHLSVLAMCC